MSIQLLLFSDKRIAEKAYKTHKATYRLLITVFRLAG